MHFVSFNKNTLLIFVDQKSMHQCLRHFFHKQLSLFMINSFHIITSHQKTSKNALLVSQDAKIIHKTNVHFLKSKDFSHYIFSISKRQEFEQAVQKNISRKIFFSSFGFADNHLLRALLQKLRNNSKLLSHTKEQLAFLMFL